MAARTQTAVATAPSIRQFHLGVTAKGIEYWHCFGIAQLRLPGAHFVDPSSLEK